MNVEDELRDIFGNRVLTRKEDMIPYTRDASFFSSDIPLAVVIPRNAMEISKLMRLCCENNIPVTVRSGGSSLTGSSVPLRGGIVISMSAMNRILEIKTDDSFVIAEAGVRLDDLNSELRKKGFFYPPDPASSMAATVGGSINTNAGGLRASLYGATKEWVLGMEVVLPTGEIQQFGGKTLKRTKGYDFTALMVGSEGTLAIITKAILKIRPMPEELGRIMAYFTDIENVGRSIMHLKSSGFIPYIAEFLDKGSLESVKIAKGIDYPKESNYLLMVDMASTHESISRIMEETSSVIKRFNPVSISITTDRAEMEKMYEARKGLYSSSLLLRESRDQYIVIADIVVPLSELSSAMREMRDIIDRSGIKAILFGHIGDGNIHGNIFASPGSEEDRTKVEKLQLDLGMVAIRHNGSVSAEHGIGVEKKELLREEMKFHNSEYTLDIMKRIKEVFDPKGLLNRGKIFD